MTKSEDLSSLLAPLNSDSFKEFTHRCADEICGRRGPSIDKFCATSSWTPSQFHSAVSGMKSLLIDCAVKNQDSIKVSEKLSLTEDHISGLMNCLSVRGDELQQCLLSNVLNSSGYTLCDHDWKLKMVMGSSLLSSLKETLLELDLITTKNTNMLKNPKASPVHERIRVELTLDNINSLITTLEKAQESL